MAVDLRGRFRLKRTTFPKMKTARCLNKFATRYADAPGDSQAKQMRLDRWFELREGLRTSETVQ